MRYAVFISSIALSREREPDFGISIRGLKTDDEIVERVLDGVAELFAQEGPPEPFLVTEAQLTAIEAALPKEKHA